jgi:hypothetical protein
VVWCSSEFITRLPHDRDLASLANFSTIERDEAADDEAIGEERSGVEIAGCISGCTVGIVSARSSGSARWTHL